MKKLEKGNESLKGKFDKLERKLEQEIGEMKKEIQTMKKKKKEEEKKKSSNGKKIVLMRE